MSEDKDALVSEVGVEPGGGMINFLEDLGHDKIIRKKIMINHRINQL
jgi:hypothetical protein